MFLVLILAHCECDHYFITVAVVFIGYHELYITSSTYLAMHVETVKVFAASVRSE